MPVQKWIDPKMDRSKNGLQSKNGSVQKWIAIQKWIDPKMDRSKNGLESKNGSVQKWNVLVDISKTRAMRLLQDERLFYIFISITFF